MVERCRYGHRAAAGDRAETHRDPGRVGEGNHHILGSDGPHVRHQLGEDRLHALSLRGSAGGEMDLARWIDAHGGAFERSDPGALDIAADPETEMSTLPARFTLAPADRLHAAYCTN